MKKWSGVSGRGIFRIRRVLTRWRHSYCYAFIPWWPLMHLHPSMRLPLKPTRLISVPNWILAVLSWFFLLAWFKSSLRLASYILEGENTQIGKSNNTIGVGGELISFLVRFKRVGRVFRKDVKHFSFFFTCFFFVCEKDMRLFVVAGFPSPRVLVK